LTNLNSCSIGEGEIAAKEWPSRRV
jgi:hypothetical protein